jgi:hypothetical protein
MNYFEHCMTHEQLEQEHRRLVIKMHPDRNPNDPDATAKFQEMQAQYEERKAELNGDYRKSAKGRERRERERREREERERREREQNRLAEVLEQARKNKQKRHTELKKGDFVYARQVNVGKVAMVFARMEPLLREVLSAGLADEAVVMVETIVEMSDEELMNNDLNYELPDGGPWGGWETIQSADPANGIRKAKRVAKVVMFRSPSYCVMGSPMGDPMISRFYMPCGYGDMYQKQLDAIIAKMRHEQQEQQRIKAERKARIEAEQRPLIDEWQGKLIAISRGLTDAEQQTVAVSNLKTVLRAKFPGVTFTVKSSKSSYGKHQFYELVWEDGPTVQEVTDVARLFDPCYDSDTLTTPWTERFGKVLFWSKTRKMNVLTKARILQQLGCVVDAFCQGGIDDEVTVSDDDWTMLHLMVGVSVGDENATLCCSTLKADGTRRVHIGTAVRYVFNRTSYVKAKVTRKSQKAQKQAA